MIASLDAPFRRVRRRRDFRNVSNSSPSRRARNVGLCSAMIARFQRVVFCSIFACRPELFIPAYGEVLFVKRIIR